MKRKVVVMRNAMLTICFVLVVFGIYSSEAWGGFNQNFVELGPVELSFGASNHVDLNSAYVYVSGSVSQDYDYKFVWEQVGQSLEIYENLSEFRLSGTLAFSLVLPENYIPDLNIDYSRYLDIEIFNLKYSLHQIVENLTEYDENWNPILTDNIRFDLAQELGNASITSSRLDVYEVDNMAVFYYTALGHFIGPDPAAIGQAYIDAGVAQLIPEPATMILFGFGGLLLRKRHRS